MKSLAIDISQKYVMNLMTNQKIGSF